ncbi:protein FAR-RED IMPAIRED RESPONSE 1-like [Carya illinoinensis]|uniref:protein FAR-RED IMPAIRED RESPONSE 1-like n=1 Tax=Carya illinoinensis TaxID=32201 RepID=UPI001C725B4F|nr:protein FAR-RED IMPAIRED RESPONSE 1-like [Carya illinoinensis]
MAKSFNALVVEVGGFEKLPFIEKDARNYIDKAQHLRLGKGGADALRGYFERMQYKNDGFYSSMDLDDDAYLINRYGIPFVSFVGVNHHGQSILLGAGLISSENTETFVWLFDTWLKCMDGKAPKAIIIDQDRVMKNPIAIVLPNIRHRYCLWHILRKMSEKLGSHAEFKCGLKSALQRCVYDSQTSDEFEKSWESLYSGHTYWVPIYLKNIFWVGMNTTQRNESMNAFFDGYVHLETTLKEFVDQFDNALRKNVGNEIVADFHLFNCTIPCISHLPLEKKFQAMYTNSKFKEVQSEVMRIIYSHCVIIKIEGAITTYQVNDQREVEDDIKKLTLQAYFNEDECEAKCMCGLFEMRGIICKYILSIFAARDVQELPEKYIMERWRNDIKRRYALIRSSDDDLSGKPAASRYSGLIKLCYKIATNACESEDNSLDITQKLKTMNSIYTKSKPQATVASTHTSIYAKLEIRKKF